jgi:hypothetical protein
MFSFVDRVDVIMQSFKLISHDLVIYSYFNRTNI